MTVLTDELLASFDASVTDVAKAVTMPPVIYTSEEFLAFERDAVFANEWLCVGRASRIPNVGDYFTTTVNSEPIIVARAKDGSVRAFSAVCQHRGMQVADDAGQLHQVHVPVPPVELRPHRPAARRAGDGAHRGVRQEGLPAARAVGRAVAGLRVRQLRSPTPAPLAPTLATYEPYVANYDLENAVCPGTFTLPDLPWNWKVMFENFNDGYHANKLHHTIQDFCPSELAAFPVEWTPDSNVIFRTNGYTHIDGGFNATTKALLPVFPKLTEEERWRSTFALMPPTLCFGTAPDQAFFFIVRPKTADTIDLEIGYLFHPSALEHPMFDHLFQMSDAGVQVFVRQDQDATTKVQRGMHSRFAARGRYSWQEASHVQFNRWLVQRYRRHWPNDHRKFSNTTNTASKRGHREFRGSIMTYIEEVHRSTRCSEPRRGRVRRRRRGSRFHRPRRPRRPKPTTPAHGGTVDRGTGHGSAVDGSTVDGTHRPPRRPAPLDLDTNGDGTVVFGIAAAGPRDDGGYYQALVDKAIAVSEENGYGDPIVVDNITTEDAATELANLAEQGVDMIFVGASEIADPLTDLIAQYPDIFWYCNCGAGYPENPGLAQSQDDSSEISYSAGYATGLLLQDSGGDNVAFIGCCDLNFEKEAYLAYELGLKAVDDSLHDDVHPDRGVPVRLRQHRRCHRSAERRDHERRRRRVPVPRRRPRAAREASPTSRVSSRCRPDPRRRASAPTSTTRSRSSSTAATTSTRSCEEIAAGTFHEGDVRVFRVGVDPQPGAEICDPTPEQADGDGRSLRPDRRRRVRRGVRRDQGPGVRGRLRLVRHDDSDGRGGCRGTHPGRPTSRPSPSATAPSSRATTSTCNCTPARSTGSSARTAPASRR